MAQEAIDDERPLQAQHARFPETVQPARNHQNDLSLGRTYPLTAGWPPQRASGGQADAAWRDLLTSLRRRDEQRLGDGAQYVDINDPAYGA
ncbi:hypothetical protein VPNG_08485 [Cytospora leucostoma]|uniref:Uncharacterized protein n=1 Tax=Cytospora leucostoma TaxID=1230097 RepID=A0A423WRJ5_9PEZI|nr:hypothetical protein VPNG_08485 [Cytospora leucostoma]